MEASPGGMTPGLEIALLARNVGERRSSLLLDATDATCHASKDDEDAVHGRRATPCER